MSKVSHNIQNIQAYRGLETVQEYGQDHQTYILRPQDSRDLQQISNKRRGSWELINWVNKHKLPAVEAVKHNGWPCLEISNLWHVLYLLFNMAQDCQIDMEILNEILSKLSSPWVFFSEEKFVSSISKYNNSLTSGPDKLLWRHLKDIIKDKTCLKEIINIANACFELGHWPSHFKTSMTIIIPKPHKDSYDSPKSFRPIILLNILGKLIEKAIGEHLQFHMISNNFIHQSQLGSLKQRSTTDTGITLIHFICIEWIRNVMTSTLAFDIAQFFPSLNHYLLPCILRKARFDSKVEYFFLNYLVGKKTQYYWNNFSLSFFNVDVRVRQDSTLSPILSTLYLALILHILKN